MSAMSDFIRNASKAEKHKVYGEVMDAARKRQNEIMSAYVSVDKLRDAFRQGFIEATKWREPVSQDVDSLAYRAAEEHFLGKLITEAEKHPPGWPSKFYREGFEAGRKSEPVVSDELCNTARHAYAKVLGYTHSMSDGDIYFQAMRSALPAAERVGVPDEATLPDVPAPYFRDADQTSAYLKGWNGCRAAMLAATGDG